MTPIFCCFLQEPVLLTAKPINNTATTAEKTLFTGLLSLICQVLYPFIQLMMWYARNFTFLSCGWTGTVFWCWRCKTWWTRYYSESKIVSTKPFFVWEDYNILLREIFCVYQYHKWEEVYHYHKLINGKNSFCNNRFHTSLYV